MDAITILEDDFNATFVRVSGGEQVWELPSMKVAQEALQKVKARPFNWCAQQQPNGPVGRKPWIVVAN